jgi:hypothetical protein
MIASVPKQLANKTDNARLSLLDPKKRFLHILAMYLTEPPTLRDTITLEAFYGVSSPWAFLGAPELRRIAKEYGLTVHLKPITVIEENGGVRVSSTWAWCADP